MLDRDVKEEAFFLQGIWHELFRSLLNVNTLRNRLSKVLLGQIAAELFSLIEEIEIKFSACRSRLDKLGEPRATSEEQRRYLLNISQSFQSLVKAFVDGTYNDSFFGDACSAIGYQKRLRAVIQNHNQDFAERIARRGHRREIIDSKDKDRVSKGVIPIIRDKFVDHVQNLMRKIKNRELSGTFNSMIVADFFLNQTTSWESIIESHIDTI